MRFLGKLEKKKFNRILWLWSFKWNDLGVHNQFFPSRQTKILHDEYRFIIRSIMARYKALLSGCFSSIIIYLNIVVSEGLNYMNLPSP